MFNSWRVQECTSLTSIASNKYSHKKHWLGSSLDLYMIGGSRMMSPSEYDIVSVDANRIQLVAPSYDGPKPPLRLR